MSFPPPPHPTDHHWLAEIPVTQAMARLVPMRPWRYPADLGVAVRGTVGKALFDIVCVRDDRACTTCDHRASCLIPQWFDPNRVGGAAPRPFALSVRRDDRVLVIEFTFTGVLPRHTAFVDALLRAAALGFGPEESRVPCVVDRLQVQGTGAPVVVVADGRVVGLWPTPAPLSRFVLFPYGGHQGADVTYRSDHSADIYLQRADLGDGAPPSFEALVMASARRVRLLYRTLTGRPLQRWWDASKVSGHWDGERVEGSRWSQRQGERVDLSGYTGVLRVGPDVHAFVDLLGAAEVLGTGKNTTTGCGRVAVKWMP